MGITLLIYFNHWLKHQTYEDFFTVIKTLLVSDIKVEYIHLKISSPL